MAHPTRITISGTGYDIRSEEEWNDLHPQIESFMATGRQLLAIKAPGGTRHVLLTDGVAMDIWDPAD